MSPLVSEGNTIYVPAECLVGDERKKVTVSWSQMMRTRTQEYWVCNYQVKSGGNLDGVIYIQTDKVDEFKSKKTGGDEFTLTVDNTFQYGQNKEQTKRFLVFHNKDNKPFQHRFVATTLSAFGKKGADIVRDLGFKGSADFVEGHAKDLFGDYLHNY
ncbi:hypothetical protein G6011_10116 [Alternaria panax]|uniref:Uncharacterized protein n=1 Tax=Alternaria panax TaxID=48097 RepID=A0AAD4FDU4_9PLEO|nr:hypothetical protein G6011_10116 [Alternaria panax]